MDSNNCSETDWSVTSPHFPPPWLDQWQPHINQKQSLSVNTTVIGSGSRPKPPPLPRLCQFDKYFSQKAENTK